MNNRVLEIYVLSTEAHASLETPSISTPQTPRTDQKERKATVGEVFKRKAEFEKPRNISKIRREMQISGGNAHTPQRR
jgi:hypothetical protein